MLGLGQYITAGLGAVILALGITNMVQCNTIKGKKEQITGLQMQVDAGKKLVETCAADLQNLRDKIDEKNAEIEEWRLKAAAGQAAQAERDRLARELAASRRELAMIAEERNQFEASLAHMPRCEKYLTTLLRIAGGGP